MSTRRNDLWSTMWPATIWLVLGFFATVAVNETVLEDSKEAIKNIVSILSVVFFVATWFFVWNKNRLDKKLVTTRSINVTTKKWWQSKTYWFNIITGVVAFLPAVIESGVLPQDWLSYVSLVIVLGNIILRLGFTSQSTTV